MQETVEVVQAARSLQRPSFLLSVTQPQECGFFEEGVLIFGGGVCSVFFSGLIFFEENKEI